jgi:hypothetical protein
MRSIYVLAAFPLAAVAVLNGRCSGSEASGYWGSHGICVTTSTCAAYGGVYKSGACPNDPTNVKCCVVGEYHPCGIQSWCAWTSTSCGGTWHSVGLHDSFDPSTYILLKVWPFRTLRILPWRNQFQVLPAVSTVRELKQTAMLLRSWGTGFKLLGCE